MHSQQPIQAASSSSSMQKSVSHHKKMSTPSRRFNSDQENMPPSDPNVQPGSSVSPSVSERLKAPAAITPNVTSGSDDLESRSAAALADSFVQVVARIRPVSGQEREETRIVRKVSSTSLSVEDHIFTLDSVVDSNSTQEDIFQLVGVPLVKNSLAGFNTSILSCGQTGSGKTYTMWGPPSAMVEGNYSPRSKQGIVPRIFRMLFSEIQEEQRDSGQKQINYQCRCSFLEIYKEQISDLLDPTQRNLHIRDDAKNGFYVENLTEEYVNSFEDVTQILIKGLSNRKVGATSINSKSSRSHVVFTCIVESWCKETSSKCFSSSKSIRISLVDLAGFERNKHDDGGSGCIKDAKNVKWSLSQLGYLVNTLANVSQSGKPQNIPYKNSCLTNLLQDSLGGNAKLTVICAISPDERCKGETLSTLRFGQRAKFIQNKAVINEISEEAVNDLSDQIRQLKEELVRVKSNGDSCSIGSNGGYFKQHNARESLNQLRLSLNRSLLLPHIDNNSEEELNINEDDVEELCIQLHNVHASCEDNSEDRSRQFLSLEENSQVDTTNGLLSMSLPPEDGKGEEMHFGKSLEKFQGFQDNLKAIRKENQPQAVPSASISTVRGSISIIPSQKSLLLEDPTFSDSPKIDSKQRKTVSFAPSIPLESQQHESESPKFNSDFVRHSARRSDHIRSSLQSSSDPIESLAASLQRGLQIIDHHSTSKNSFSFENLILRQSQAVDKADISMQALSEEEQYLGSSISSFLCASCKQRVTTGTTDRLKNQFTKEEKKLSANAIRREGDLEKVDQYKLEHQHGEVTEQSQDTNTLSGVLPIIKEAKNEENMLLLANECKILRLDYENNPEVLSANGDPMELKKGLDREYRGSFSIDEREVLLMEIQNLKDQLHSYVNASSNGSIQKHISPALENSNSLDEAEKEIEKERQKCTEMESRWISLTEELRMDLESNRRLAAKAEHELKINRICLEESEDALQRAVLGHVKFVEHYADLQEKYNGLLEKHRKIMEGIAEVKRAAAKAGGKSGSRFAESLAAELSALRVERDRERDHLRKENKSLKVQLRDTAEAVHTAGELLVRLKEAEEAVSAIEEKFMQAQQETERVKKQMEKLKKKHKMEIVTMKQYLAESRLPEAALRPTFKDELDHTDDQDWRAEFSLYHQDSYDNSVGYNSNVRSYVDLYRDK